MRRAITIGVTLVWLSAAMLSCLAGCKSKTGEGADSKEASADQQAIGKSLINEVPNKGGGKTEGKTATE